MNRPRFEGTRRQREQITVLHSMTALADAGFPLVEVISESLKSVTHPGLKTGLTNICNAVNAGRRFSDALADYPVFPGVVTGLVRAGEASGTLNRALGDAAGLLETRFQRKQEIAAALTYPLLIVFLTALAAIFLAITVIPRITDLYTASGHPAPLVTRIILWCGRGLLLACAAALATVPVFLTGNRTRYLQMILEKTVHSIPVFARLLDAWLTGLWARTLSVLLSNGIPATDAVRLTGELMAGTPVGRHFKTVESQIREGQSIPVAFAAAGEFPDLALRLIQAGDRAGTLAGSLEKVAGIHDLEYRVLSRKLVVLAEPLAVIFAGLLVLLVALGVMLPMADLGGLF